MDAIQFPRHLDDPPRLLFFTPDQIAPFAVFFGLGVMSDSLFLCSVAGVGVSWLLTRYRDSRPDGFLAHMAYWYGIMVPKGRAVINPFLRRILPA